MANLWDDLDEDQQTELVNMHLSGSRKDNANLNRAREQLANNPNLVMRLAEEAGINHAADAEMDDTAPDGDESDNVMDGQSEIDRAVNASIDDADMQETGSVTNQSEIPPPQEGESISEYMDRLLFMQDQSMKEDGSQDLVEDVDGEYDRSNRNVANTMEDLHYPEDAKEGDKAAAMRDPDRQRYVRENVMRPTQRAIDNGDPEQNAYFSRRRGPQRR